MSRRMGAVLETIGLFISPCEKSQVSESYVTGPNYSAEYQHVERRPILSGTVKRHSESTDCHCEPSSMIDHVLYSRVACTQIHKMCLKSVLRLLGWPQ